MLLQSIIALGFTADEAKTYLDLLEHSPSSVRKIATRTGIGRQTVFTILKKLIGQGYASYHDRGKSRIFAAEDPKALKNIIKYSEDQISKQRQTIQEVLPDLNALYSYSGHRPAVKYYEGTKEVSEMLHDVISTMSQEKDKKYYVYSTKGERQIIYSEYPEFSADRIKSKIHVQVIAIGKGGELRGLDERKWLDGDTPEASSYMVIYGNKISMVALDSASKPFGVIIEDAATAQTQKLIFRKLWKVI